MKEKINLSVLNLHLINYIKENNNAAMINFVRLINSVIGEEENETKQKDLFELVELLKMTFESFDYNRYVFNKSLPDVLKIETESNNVISSAIDVEKQKGGNNGQERKDDNINRDEKVNDTIKDIQISNIKDAIEDTKDAIDYYQENNKESLNESNNLDSCAIYFLDVEKVKHIHNAFTKELTEPYDVLTAFNYINFCCESKILNENDMVEISKDFNIPVINFKTLKVEHTDTIIDIIKVNYNLVKFEKSYIVVC